MWHAKPTGGYSRNSDEGQDNVREMALVMIGQGWSLPAIAAMLGNGAGEGGLNPWRWEGDVILASTDTYEIDVAQDHGYGLFGFTPAGSYIHDTWAMAQPNYGPNFSDIPGIPQDGANQMAYFARTVESNFVHEGWLYNYYYDDFQNVGVDIDDFYWMTFEEFKAGNDTIENLTGAFELCYEKPNDYAAASSYQDRVDDAQYWLTWLQGQGFGTAHLIMKRKRNRLRRKPLIT